MNNYLLPITNRLWTFAKNCWVLSSNYQISSYLHCWIWLFLWKEKTILMRFLSWTPTGWISGLSRLGKCWEWCLWRNLCRYSYDGVMWCCVGCLCLQSLTDLRGERVGLMGIEKLRALMGHTNIQTTLRYHKITSSRAEEVANKALETLIKS